MENQCLKQFKEYFPGNNDNVRLFFAPGRINLIGEHTDYNGGYVFPAALTIGTYMAIRQRNDGIYRLKSENFPLEVSVDIKQPIVYDKDDDWANYPKGVLQQLQKLDIPLSGADVLYVGDIPNGAGLSSSASIGMVSALGFSVLEKQELPMLELAKLCQQMENQFIGVNSGIMDQFAVGFGKKDHAVFLDCQSHEFELIPLEIEGHKLVITNTNKRRGLADSKYNERRTECEQGLDIIQKFAEGVTSLGELTPLQYKKVEAHLADETIRKRVRHVVTEDDRVQKAVAALENKDLYAFGLYMKESHLSLRDDYEVTGLELDALFTIQEQLPGCIGTRMTGAGFGGCTISIVADGQVEVFKQNVAVRYKEQTGLTPDFYVCEIGDGVKELEEVKK
ncbi:galactokinase [Fictibacillus sp. KIGAM418]|uniref:Galactokinase n=1 Tax=Fictibacillus marinisediminis TaxID=2878389 RepID=A0A9X1XE21_9BACL|nr:galactokinase [Fictibacillus marinisediminis]MCK6259162.1 galactokinase [Fictibacillus marinisediminis]